MRDENKTRQIMATARLMQAAVNNGVINIDTVIIQPDRVILAKGVYSEDNYMELDEIMIDDKEVEEYQKDLEPLKKTVERIVVRGKVRL